MARKAREISCINCYTVVIRGHDEIFSSPNKIDLFFQCLHRAKLENVKIYSYAISSKNVYLVINASNYDLSLFMKKLTVSFAKLYNSSMLTTGKVFMDRYLSTALSNDNEVFNAIKSLHNLTTFVKADKSVIFITSFDSYFDDSVIDSSFVKQYINTHKENDFYTFDKYQSETNFKIRQLNDEQVCQYILSKHNVSACELNKLNATAIEKILIDVSNCTKASARQIARITSLPLRYLWKLFSVKKVGGNYEKN